MTEATKTIIRTAISGDATASDEERKSVLDALTHKTFSPLPPAVPYREAAERLGVRLYYVSRLVQRGVLTPVYTGPGCKRSRAVTRDSLAACLAGGRRESAGTRGTDDPSGKKVSL